MELTPEERQRIYEEEKARLQAQSQIKAENKSKPTSCSAIGCAVILGLVVLVAIIGSFFNSSEKSTRGSDQIGAYVYAQVFVKHRLKAPSTAKFCGFSEANVVTLGGDSYQVSGWVDAQNAFGAMLRNSFVCKLHKTGTTWYLDEPISLGPR
jgi:hypothetical protein